MDRFNALQTFITIAEQGSFAGAARSLGQSPPAVTRAISALENQLGTRLFLRTTRSVRLTESGERFMIDSKRILADLAEAEQAAIGTHAEPRGNLKITAPVLFGRLYVTPILGDYLDSFGEITAETLFVDRVVNLMDEGLDVAIRIGELPDSGLTAIRTGKVRRVVVASPSYLARFGRPERPKDLSAHEIIAATATGSVTNWQFFEDESPFSIAISPRLKMNTNDAAIEMISRGHGVSRLLSYQVAPLITQGILEPVLENYEPPPLPIHVVHQEGRLVSSRVRSFVDFMVERLRANADIN
jgi:DNA-binding transcriptional LysR family regulator